MIAADDDDQQHVSRYDDTEDKAASDSDDPDDPKPKVRRIYLHIPLLFLSKSCRHRIKRVIFVVYISDLYR